MRFVKDGPNFPDELLIARDEGRVVFFCGAGVSRARVGLKDFIGLARAVADKLAIGPDKPARQLISAIETVPLIPGVGSLISADRVFGLMEREYRSRDIYCAIAQALRPESVIDLSAHRLLLDLAKGPDGKVRLITTNFDILFEECDPAIPFSAPPRLPDPKRSDEFNGIIHLHGHVNRDYSDAEGDGFVISSAEFGRAYLADRWAADFIRKVLESYFVVFVGYSADDPPMQYLLEALNRSPGSLNGVYALQSGSFEEAEARWFQKGVKPIVYDQANGHAALWDSLAMWAERARNVSGWYDDLFARAMPGPEGCEQHVRGQVAHVVSTLEGARRLALAPTPIPASWLCTFDPAVRFAQPGRIGKMSEERTHFDPFPAYGIDSDPVPAHADQKTAEFNRRDIPESAWSAFALTREDRQNLREDQVASLRGHYAINLPRLAARVGYLGSWLENVAHQPASVWWAAGQSGLHADIQRRIRYRMERGAGEASSVVRSAWRHLVSSWSNELDDFSVDYYQLLAEIKIDGWTAASVRELARCHRPYLKAKRAIMSSPRPPDDGPDQSLNDLLHLDVEYPGHGEDISVPEGLLPILVKELRQNLELGSALEVEAGGYGLYSLNSIDEEDDEDHSQNKHRSGINAPIFQYVKVFGHLAKANIESAKREARAWFDLQGPVAAHIKVWFCADRSIIDPREIGTLLRSISREEFWSSPHQRDLLLALEKRWTEMPQATRRSIERRLLRGRERWEGETISEFRQRSASAILSRIHYLRLKGVQFSFDIEGMTQELLKRDPEWREEWAQTAAFSVGMRSGWVRTDTESSELLNKPLGQVLEFATRASGRSPDRLFVQRDPFKGLCEAKPVRAFSALTLAAKSDSYPAAHWQTFFNDEKRKDDPCRFVLLILGRINAFPGSFLSGFVRSITGWLLRVHARLLPDHRLMVDELWDRLLCVLKSRPATGETAVVRSGQPEWATEALNAPVGELTQVLLADPAISSAKAGTALPEWWKWKCDELLSLPGDNRRHALTILCHNLVWLYSHDEEWVSRALLPAVAREDDDADAFWAGFFWGAKVPQENLFVKLKPALLRLTHRNSETRRRHTEILAGIVLASWGRKLTGSDSTWIADDEMTALLVDADDDFRSQLLWYLKQWIEQPDSEWGERAVQLFDAVWPKQISVKTPRVSASLAELAFAQKERFPLFVKLVLPLVVPIDQDYIHLPMHEQKKDDLVDKYPEPTLALLNAVLTENARQWPYGVSEVLERIGKADPKLLTDDRLIRLNRIRSSF